MTVAQKMKVKKGEFVYFDGEWVGTGYWAAKAMYVKLSDKKLQGFVDAGTKFSQRNGTLVIGEEANIPEISRVIPEITEGEGGIERTSFLFDSKTGNNRCIIFKSVDGKRVLVTEELGLLLPQFDNLYQNAPLQAIAAYSIEDGKVVPYAVVMPTSSEGAGLESALKELTT